MSDNGGPFTIFKDDGPTNLTDTFTGVGGHTYAFYTIATDNAGNVEAAPSVPDATTQILSPNAPPTSKINALAAYQKSSSIALSWTGVDNSGSGIAGFDVYVADNGGAFTLFKHEGATTLSDTFTGVDGHQYGFYTIASDNAGNVEDAPSTADATTVVDLTAPMSSITALGPIQNSVNIQLAWTGSDGANGSGIAGFDIYVSDNNGAAALWKHEAATTLADTYMGVNGHSYSFYSRATDNAGNVEAAPGTADASTLIDLTAPTSSVTALPSFEASGSFNVAWSGTDGVSGSGITAYDIFVSDNGGAYTAFQSHTTNTSAQFTGKMATNIASTAWPPTMPATWKPFPPRRMRPRLSI